MFYYCINNKKCKRVTTSISRNSKNRQTISVQDTSKRCTIFFARGIRAYHGTIKQLTQSDMIHLFLSVGHTICHSPKRSVVYTPVSYTHLDVYKRQIPLSRFTGENNNHRLLQLTNPIKN